MANLQFKTDNTPTPSATQAVIFTPELKQAVKKTFDFENVEVYEEAEAKIKGALGHAIMMPFKFERSDYTHKDKSGSSRRETPELLIPICIMEPTRTKMMEETAVEGRDGTVKEFGCFGDYIVNIKGILIGADGKYPKKEMQHLAAFENVPVAIPVANDILLDLGVTDLVIKKVTWVPMEGVENAQAFQLDCVSDTQVRLKLTGEV